MISKLLSAIENGVKRLFQNGRLLFVAFLVFVFPVVFLFTVQSFLDTAYTNIQTAEKQRVGILHDSISSLVAESPRVDLGLVASISQKLQKQNDDITEIRLVQKMPEGLLIVSSLDTTKVGSMEEKPDAYLSTPNNPSQSFIYEFTRNNERTWQAIRPIVRSDGTQYYILTEHTFGRIDSVMASRKLAAYGALVGIFIFLIMLAYWLVRQIDWEFKYRSIKNTLDERDLFTNMIAHEFRTPLTAIKGYGSLLADSTTLQPNEREYLNKMFISSERLLALVNDFLEVARIQSGRMKLELESLDVRALCAEVAVALAPIATEHALDLHPPEAGAPILLKADKKRLFQVIQNLVSNALKYTEKGSVTFSVEETPLTVTLRIKDTGLGISAEDQQKLFAPFSRVGGAEKSGVTGTGLGMWITKQYVELLGGSISVESIKGVGTHVVVTFKRRT